MRLQEIHIPGKQSRRGLVCIQPAFDILTVAAFEEPHKFQVQGLYFVDAVKR
jgi:hypothetical protein